MGEIVSMSLEEARVVHPVRWLVSGLISPAGAVSIMASLYLVRGILMLTLVLLNIHILKSNCESITRDSEKAALLKLEQDWGKPAALNWSSITNTDHCDWSGVICTDGFVTGLSLAGRDLYKPIPKAICSFKNLFYIDLSKNQISGYFRTSIFNCSKLQHLDLSFNSLFGFLPANIHKLSPKLAYLNLASNSLSGSIPSAICQLHGLRFLHLDNNYFNESYPAELGNLSELQVLSLAYNPFAPGRMHPQFGNLSNIKYLWMNNMNIVGEIPDTMSQLSQLRLLDLSSNRLNGMILVGFGG
ncbi:receptor-like protein 52 [Miscanthus floridulus]|uniref:receptor-like protein 52 n=1 Tax=Miscanthus floridulus TaxID=154761 RepID=UPI0034592FD5